jgi:hypothetical protein
MQEPAAPQQEAPKTEVLTIHGIYGSLHAPATVESLCRASGVWLSLSPGGTRIRVADIVHFRPWPVGR